MNIDKNKLLLGFIFGLILVACIIGIRINPIAFIPLTIIDLGVIVYIERGLWNETN
jgi:hypothetical protein